MKNLKEVILESPIGYGLWSTPFNKPKIAAIKSILKDNNITSGRVLDVGCGPGSNAPVFEDGYDYLGVDFNPHYIEAASKNFPRMSFKVGDATKLALDGKKFDIILINSLMHHLNDEECRVLMQDIKPVLESSGIVVVQEMLIPPKENKLMTFMMNQDRGDYYRHLKHWQDIFSNSGYQIVDEDFYNLKLFSITGWNMVSVLLRAK